MFTGIVEELGTIYSIKRGASSAAIEISADLIFGDLKIGDSVAVNGICLTATSVNLKKKTWTADVMHETLNRSSLGLLNSGDKVNLERAMAANGRFGGHIVSGHIDGTGHIISMKPDDNAVLISISAAPEILRLIVEKGSITIDGISLTVTEVTETHFSVSIIPHTMKETVLGFKKPGDKVNLENDVIGKYVERLLGAPKATTTQKKSSGLTLEFLAEHGF